MTKTKQKEIGVIPVKSIKLVVKIRGLTSLILNAMTEAKVDHLLSLQTKGKKAQRDAKNPEQDFKNSLYPKQNGFHVFPAIGIKKAIIGAAHTFAPNIPKTQIRGAFFIPVDFVAIKGPEPVMRRDIVRVGQGKPDVRFRAEFLEWEMDIVIDLNENGPVTVEQLINLINIAGYSVGIGDWRPSCNGIHGRFEVIVNEKTKS